VARRARGRGRPVPPLPAARRLARGGRAGQARVVRARGVLGPADPGLRRPGRAADRLRARARRTRREPDRPRVHRRPLRRLPRRGHAPHRPGQPADVGQPRRRPGAARRVDHGRGALRAAGEQADAGRARHVPGVGPAGARAARARARAAVPRRLRVGRRAAAPRRHDEAQAEVRPPRRAPQRPVRPARLLPPQPAEHVHRPPHPADARRGAEPGEGASGRTGRGAV
ncbi:MAG: Uracil-DNA glycosylase, family 5, partial [uncultured Solirubrobacteraceae bacterium]